MTVVNCLKQLWITSVPCKCLQDFTTKNTIKLLEALNILKELFNNPLLSTWQEREVFQDGVTQADSLTVVNDHAESAVALEQNFNKTTKHKDQLQCLLHLVSDHRKRCPDALM